MRRPEKHAAKDGSITWRVRFRDTEISPRTGKPLQSSETFDKQSEAERFAGLLAAGLSAAEALRQMDLEMHPQTRMTLDQLAEQFFAWKATRVRSDRTVHDYRRDYTNWIKPTLGHRAADSITERDVQELIDSMNGHLEAKTIVDRHAILHGILSWACGAARGYLDHNPCVGTELPKRRKTPPKGLRPAEWHALYPALRQIDGDGADFALFLLSSGWRFSEAAAVTGFDIEDDGLRVVVNMGRVLRRNAAGQHVLVDDGKSDAAIRRLTLDPESSSMVRRRMDAVAGDALVFTTKTGRQWHSSNFNERIWQPAVTAAGLTRHPTPHWLRHTNVAWLVMGGQVSLPEIQRRIGHEHISTTIDVYGRMIEDVSTDALDAFAAVRDGATGTAGTRALPLRTETTQQ